MDPQKQLRCTICGRTFTRLFHRIRHERQLHGKLAAKSKLPKQTVPKPYRCGKCDKSFSRSNDLGRHMLSCGIEAKKRFKCDACAKSFTRKDHWTHHMSLVHGLSQRPNCCGLCGVAHDKVSLLESHIKRTHPSCECCGLRFADSLDLEHHVDEVHPSGHRFEGVPLRSRHFGEVETAFHGSAKTYRFSPTSAVSPKVLGDDEQDNIADILRLELEKAGGLKWYLVFHVRLGRLSHEAGWTENVLPIRSPCDMIFRESDLAESVRAAVTSICDTIEKIELQGSGWVVRGVKHADINTVEYAPLWGGSYICLPQVLLPKDGYSLLNVRSVNGECFRDSFLATQHWQDTAPEDRFSPTSYKPFTSNYDFRMIPAKDAPIVAKNLQKFQEANDVQLNIYGFEKTALFPIFVGEGDFSRTADLLYISKQDRGHFVAIVSLSGLLKNQSGLNVTQVCRRCIRQFNSRKELDRHMTECRQHRPSAVTFPTDNDPIKFRNIHKMLRVGSIVYSDLESLLKPGSGNTLQVHTPCAAAAYCLTDNGIEPKKFLRRISSNYDSKAMMTDFMNFLLECAKAWYTNSRKNITMKPEDKISFSQAVECHVCKKAFSFSDVKTADHDHWSGEYRGAAHRHCNAMLRLTNRLPVIMHGLRNYDSHHIINTVKDLGWVDRIEVIPHNMEQYISFSLKVGDLFGAEEDSPNFTIVFVDSFAFMNRSLADLAKNLPEFPILEKELISPNPISPIITRSRNSRDARVLLTRKGVLPYDYISTENVFSETSLPPRQKFYSVLHESDISSEGYDHATAVWKAFDCQTLGDYIDLYLATDVLLLSDIFEKFRSTCFESYGLDPAHYLTAASLSWDACLKITGIELDPITDGDIHLFIESGIRGGLAQISHRFAKANNERAALNELDFLAAQLKTFIIYYDMNNLYGTAMVMKLPYGRLEWIDAAEICDILENYSDDSDIGYICEVDLEYPDALHDKHNDYPLAPESAVPFNVSPVTHRLSIAATGKPHKASTKLIAHLGPRIHYVLHVSALKLYLKLGMKLTKTHRILRFAQKAWLRPYIELNTDLRAKAGSVFEKDFYKLMNNSIYGKTIENVRKRMKIKLVGSAAALRRHVNKPTYVRHVIFAQDFVGIEKRFLSIELNKPIYVGMSILDLSKTLMYRFHYEHMLPKYGVDRLRMLMTDTDSLVYHVMTDNIYADMLSDRDLFDTSDYPKDDPLHSQENKKKLGKMKDELAGRAIRSFVGLRAKMYSIEVNDGVTINRAKGIARYIVKDRLEHSDFMAALFGAAEIDVAQRSIQSRHHNLFTTEQLRRGLSSIDDKRFVCDDGVATYAHGHYRIRDL